MAEYDTILKWFHYIGGIIEIFLGVSFLFLDQVLAEIGLVTVPIFNQLCGVLVILFGIMLLYATRDFETYKIITLTNCILRFSIFPFGIINMITYPELFNLFLFSLMYDIFWAVSVLILLKKSEYI
ncbi:MAG: hypothetical protein EU544_04690 [Promethearchaeota archaeon]|nr:MAG: hypothetical protein EU544_04690 [Candidatus Lokiarchaeota archaeon]